MKVEELFVQEKLNQVGVTLQRKGYETEIDIFPALSPFVDSVAASSRESVMSELTTAPTEDRLCKVVKHQTPEEFHAIPLKRIDSGPHQHRIQGFHPPTNQPAVAESGQTSQHFDLLKEIDNDAREIEMDEKIKIPKKESTLSRMLKGLRKENSSTEDDAEKLNTNISLSKMLQKMNPVGKNSRDGFSKVFHRIGDALQKKPDEERGNTLPKEKHRSLEWKVKGNGLNVDSTNPGEHKLNKIGEKKFKVKPSKSAAEVDKGV